MDKYEFQDAFSAVRASDTLRQEVINMTETKRKPIRLTTKILIAAAIIALLATTAVAAPTVIAAIKGSRTEYLHSNTGRQDDWPNADQNDDTYNVYLNIELNPDAPDDVLVHYLPDIPAEYTQYHGFQSDIERLYAWCTDENAGWDLVHEDEIIFVQWPGGLFNDRKEQGIDWICWITVPEGTKPVEKIVELGGISGYLVETTYGFGSRIFFWSDGDYVFKLEVPDEYTDQQLAALIESVHIVENIDPYIWND